MNEPGCIYGYATGVEGFKKLLTGFEAGVAEAEGNAGVGGLKSPGF